MPISSKHLEPSIQIDPNKLIGRRTKDKNHYEKSSKLRSDFKVGESVITKKEKCWVPGGKVKKCSSPRSYWVRDNFIILVFK